VPETQGLARMQMGLRKDSMGKTVTKRQRTKPIKSPFSRWWRFTGFWEASQGVYTGIHDGGGWGFEQDYQGRRVASQGARPE